jgi:hypothetical protein
MTVHNKQRHIYCVILISFVITLGSTTKVIADECVVPREIKNNRPDPKGTPTKISVGIYVVDIKEVSDVSQSFNADFLITVQWRDPRLSTKSNPDLLAECDLDINNIWNPRISIVNRKKIERVVENIKIDPLGNIVYRVRFIGDMSSRFNLREFPFDKGLLNISLVSRGYSPDEVSFYVNKKRTGQSESFSIVEWKISPVKTNITTEYIDSRDHELSRFDLLLDASRYRGFYLWKVFFPLTFIVFMAGSVFWIDPLDLPAQIGVSTSSIITLIAFQFSLGYLLPKISYFTRADKFLVGSTVLVFLAMGEAIITSSLAKGGKLELSHKIDRWARVIYPAIFIINSCYALWL